MKKDKIWLEICDFMAGKLSTCSRKQYAAIILGQNGRVLGVGYNGSPPKVAHCNEGACPRLHSDSPHGSSYENCIAVHAEANALMWSDIDMRQDSTLIINGPPCYNCAKLICGSGIKRVVCYRDDNYLNFKEVFVLFDIAGIDLTIYDRG